MRNPGGSFAAHRKLVLLFLFTLLDGLSDARVQSKNAIPQRLDIIGECGDAAVISSMAVLRSEVSWSEAILWSSAR